MIRITSNWTLFWKMFIPIIYATWMLTFGLTLIFTDNSNFDLFFSPVSKVIYWAVILPILALFYFKFWTFKRIEFDQNHFYITNYFKTIRIPHAGVDKVTFGSMGKVTAKLHLKQKGYFGDKIRFVPYQLGLEELQKRTEVRVEEKK